MKLDADVVVHVKGGIAYVMKLKRGMTAIVIDEDASDDTVYQMKRGRGLKNDRASQTDEEKVEKTGNREVQVAEFLNNLGDDGI